MAIIEIILLIIIIWLILKDQPGKTNKLNGHFLNSKHKILLDSCALIDGRIVNVVQAGFLQGELIVPQFILNELQLLADGQDSHKRERARFGLDVIHELQTTKQVTLSIDRNSFPAVSATDDKLISAAKKLGASLYTTDYNLSKVAIAENITVLNINELAQQLRPVNLPGEQIEIKIIQKGSNQDQGVGYLEDGTMIVVDGAARYIGQQMIVHVDRMHQTVAGKMAFAHAVSKPDGKPLSGVAEKGPRTSSNHDTSQNHHSKPSLQNRMRR
ncbi:MAG TPA: TRAM domain-containing protein [Candidatus Saccharimonadales bacterium]|jgi:uncharacterized protein YacL|nr:TRAM domain-containing protein [Candidatus Saccharimonadales bacterium]